MTNAGTHLRQARTRHPGVKLLSRVRRTGTVWLARWVDPDTGRTKEVSLARLGLNSDEARVGWCKTKSRSIHQRRADLLSGVEPIQVTAIADAVDEFYLRRATLKKVTLASYRNGTDGFLSWACSAGLATTEAITPRYLLDFRAWWASRPAMLPASGERRGQRQVTEKRRSPLTINRGLGVVRAMLNEWRMIGATPKLTSDLIRDALKFERRCRCLPHFLRIHEISALVEAALKHDAETFALTRAEHDGDAEPGSTRRYEPISPLVLVALLTGCRFGELASLRWASISLAENEILLSHWETKTRQARRIDLTPTPMLAALLGAMRTNHNGEYCLGGVAPLRRDMAEAARKRLILKYGSPKFTWHDLRRTCGTYLTCAPAIYGGASAYLSAKRLGHSVAVAETYYVGAVTNIDKAASTLEAVMGLKAEQFDRAAANWLAPNDQGRLMRNPAPDSPADCQRSPQPATSNDEEFPAHHAPAEKQPVQEIAFQSKNQPRSKL